MRVFFSDNLLVQIVWGECLSISNKDDNKQRGEKLPRPASSSTSAIYEWPSSQTLLFDLGKEKAAKPHSIVLLVQNAPLVPDMSHHRCGFNSRTLTMIHSRRLSIQSFC